MIGKKILAVIPTFEEFEYFKERALKSKNSSQRLVHLPTAGSSSNTIRLSVEDQRFQHWLEVYIVCLGGQGHNVDGRFRRLLDDIDPHLVIVGGIAGGILGHDLCIGDLAVSDFVHTPNYEKAHPDASKANLRPLFDDLADHIASTKLFSELSEKLTKLLQKFPRPTDDELRIAAKNQSLRGADEHAAVQKARTHFDRLFDPSRGVLIARTETYSQPTNQQGLDNAFKRYSDVNPELGIAEMEAAIIWSELKRSGRRSGPLVVKCISDTLGLARSEKLKEMCRRLAAEALFGFFDSPEFSRALGLRDQTTGVDKLAQNSFTRSDRERRLDGLIVEDTLIRLTSNPKSFSDREISQITNQMRGNAALSAAMADVWIHFTEVCPRCSRGAPEYVRLRPVITQAILGISRSNDEIVRVGKLAGVAPLYGIPTSGLEALDWSSLVRSMRGDPNCESKRTALMGRVYELISRDLELCVRFLIQLDHTGEFHDQSISIWFFTAVAAAVSRGEKIEAIRATFPEWWDKYLDLYNERNPYSYMITSLLPILSGETSLLDDNDAIRNMSILADAAVGGRKESDLGLAERVISFALLSKADPTGFSWDAEAQMDAELFTSVNYMPLAPMGDIQRNFYRRQKL